MFRVDTNCTKKVATKAATSYHEISPFSEKDSLYQFNPVRNALYLYIDTAWQHLCNAVFVPPNLQIDERIAPVFSQFRQTIFSPIDAPRKTSVFPSIACIIHILRQCVYITYAVHEIESYSSCISSYFM